MSDSLRLSRRRSSVRHRNVSRHSRRTSNNDGQDTHEAAIESIVNDSQARNQSRRSSRSRRRSKDQQHSSSGNGTSEMTSRARASSHKSARSSSHRRSLTAGTTSTSRRRTGSSKEIVSHSPASSSPTDPADLFLSHSRGRSSSKRSSLSNGRQRHRSSSKHYALRHLRRKASRVAKSMLAFAERVATDGALAALAAGIVLLVGLAVVGDANEPSSILLRFLLAVGFATDVYSRHRLPDIVLVVLFATTAVRLCSLVPFGGGALLLNVSGAFGLGFTKAFESVLRPRSSSSISQSSEPSLHEQMLLMQRQNQDRSSPVGNFNFDDEESLASNSNRNRRDLNVLGLFRGTFFGVWTSFPGMVADAADNAGVRWGAAYILGALCMGVYAMRIGRQFGKSVVKDVCGSRKRARKVLREVVRVMPALCAFIAVMGAVDVSTLIMYTATVGGCVCGDSLAVMADSTVPPSIVAHSGGDAETWMGVAQQAFSNTAASVIALFAAQSQARLPGALANKAVWLTSEVEGSVAGSASGFCDTLSAADAVLAEILPDAFVWGSGGAAGRRRRRDLEKVARGEILPTAQAWPQFHWIALTIDLVVAFQMLTWYPTAGAAAG